MSACRNSHARKTVVQKLMKKKLAKKKKKLAKNWRKEKKPSVRLFSTFAFRRGSPATHITPPPLPTPLFLLFGPVLLGQTNVDEDLPNSYWVC